MSLRQSKIKSEKREKKNKPKMKISGRSVFQIKQIITNKSNTKKSKGK